jgi:hypothetical protein
MKAWLHRLKFLLCLIAAGCGSHGMTATRDAASPGDEVAARADTSHDPLPSGADRVPDASPGAVPDAAADASTKDLPVDLLSGDPGRKDGTADVAAGERPASDAMDLAWDVPSDLAPPPSDGGLEDFCSGNTPRMVVNGITTVPTVVGQVQGLDCCDSGRFVATTGDFLQPVGVEWRVKAGPTAKLPATVDLGHLPDGWSVTVLAGCNLTSPGCFGPLDYFTTGFAGSLAVTLLDGSLDYDMSLCMQFQEPPEKPGDLLHSLILYAPHVSTRK